MTENIDDVDFDEVQARVQAAVRCLQDNDLYLFEKDACERAIAHRFAVCLEREFPGWQVDCEYDVLPPNEAGIAINKYANLRMRRKEGKFIALEEKEVVSVYPDIIVHHRGTDENLLVIEVKKSKHDDEIAFDLMKLEAYRQDGHLQYRFALFVRFQVPQTGKEIVDAELFRWV